MSRRDSPQSTSSSGSTSSIRVCNPNVFSDDYALEPVDTHEVSPFDADDDPTPTSTSATPSLHTAASMSRQLSPDSATSASIQPPSMSYKPPGRRDVASPVLNRTASTASNTFSDIHRASSTSSHFSMPRAQSPYVGATGPSHPYGMYPQITRTSSIASASTVRPVERPFVAPRGPEHPYAMYSQSTVPEEDDVSLAQATIPLGFPGMGQQYQSGAETRRNDIADIVGSDGHIEELPPYTRYADEVAPKERPSSIHAVNLPAVVPQEVLSSPQSPHAQDLIDALELNSASTRNTCSDSSGSFKEKIRQKSKQRVCGGLPFWFFFVITGVLLIGVVLGAIVGGVIGSRKGAVPNASTGAYENSSVLTATVTSTAFIDGAPLPTDHPVPDVPNGHYNVPTYGIQVNSKTCIENPELHGAWACLPPSGVGITVTGQGWGANLTLDPYTLNNSFMYGAQPPDLGLQPLKLTPSMDQDSNDLGPSLFAWTYYDKLTILHEDELQPNMGYKSEDRSRRYATSGDKPWFCWFNQTVLEFFIYVDKHVDTSATTTTTTESSSPPSTTLSTSTSLSSTTSTSSSTPSVTLRPPIPSFDVPASFHRPTSAFSAYKERRGRSGDDRPHDSYSDYARLVKIEEKRKPSDNIPPYCQQMQVLDNGEIVPCGVVAQIPVLEIEPVDVSTRNRFRRRDINDDLNQNCACEWISG